MSFIDLFEERQDEAKNQFFNSFGDESEEEEEPSTGIGIFMSNIKENETVGSLAYTLYTPQEIVQKVREAISLKTPSHRCAICKKTINPSFRWINTTTIPKLLEKVCFCYRHYKMMPKIF